MCCDVLCHYLSVLQRYKLLEGKKSSPFLQEVDLCSPTVLTTLGGREKNKQLGDAVRENHTGHYCLPAQRQM